MADLKFQIGDQVVVTGTMYQSANGQLPERTLTRATAVVTRIAENASHPYAINNTLGWFDEQSLTKYVEPPVHIGDKVSLIKNVTYSGKRLNKVRQSYEVLEIDGEKAILGHNGIQSTIVNVWNLKKL